MKIDYSKLTFTELVNKIGSSRYFDLPKMLKEILSRLTPQAPKYKVYTALLSQSGTDAPVATVLENTLGGEVIWSYDGQGTYIATLAEAFIENKTFLSNNISQNQEDTKTDEIEFYRLDVNSIALDTKTFDGTDLLDVDDILNNNSVEIRVYN